MVERKTIRPEAEVYERMNKDRKAHDLGWDEYLEGLYDGGISVHVCLSTEQVEEIAKLSGRKAAEAIEEQMANNQSQW